MLDEIRQKRPSQPWKGLARYNTDDQATDGPEHAQEYAKVATLLETPALDLTYYADTAGTVPDEAAPLDRLAGLEVLDVGNGDLSPEWGVDVTIHGGNVNYGPWMDRQRAAFQSVFQPAVYHDNLPTPTLSPGDERLHTALKIFVLFSADTVLRIPTKEPSKDWKYDGKSSHDSSVVDLTTRPYGWLDVAFASDSTVNFVIPMVVGPDGYESLLEVHLVQLSVSTSVNYAPTIVAPACRLSIQLPSPIVWTELHSWAIDVTLASGKDNDTPVELSLIRDHMTLFTDVVRDFTSGPSGDAARYVPYTYTIKLTLLNYALVLFLNQGNIINNPTEPSDNTLLRSTSPRTEIELFVPSDVYMADSSAVSFKINVSAYRARASRHSRTRLRRKTWRLG